MKKLTVLSLIFMSTVAVADLIVPVSEIKPVSEVKPMEEKSKIIEFEDYEEEPIPVQKNKPAAEISVQEQMLQAIKNVDKNKVKELIKQGADVNALKQEKVMVSCGPACDGYKIIVISPLRVALTQKEEYKKMKEREQEELKDPSNYEPYNTREEVLASLKEYTQKEKDLEDIIKLLKSKGAKDINRKIDSPVISKAD